MVLRGEADPHQVGAFLMLLRFRGEDPEEVAGLVEAAREAIGAGPPPAGCAPVDLDWPSYGAGRTRDAPWFLLAALALARSGRRVLMHGSNEFSSGMPVSEALSMLGLRPATDRADALHQLDATGFAYLPLATMSPALAGLLDLRRLLGLRSPINTVARLLDPFDACAGVDGVFHPPYIALHLAAAARLGGGACWSPRAAAARSSATRPSRSSHSSTTVCPAEPRSSCRRRCPASDGRRRTIWLPFGAARPGERNAPRCSPRWRWRCSPQAMPPAPPRRMRPPRSFGAGTSPDDRPPREVMWSC